MNKLHIIFCKGMQASGKSTWAKQFVKDNQNYKRVCRDDIRHMVSSYTFDNENEKLVSSIEESVIMSTIFKKYNLIVDKMNLNNKQLNLDIATIKAHAKDIGYKEEDIEIEIKEFPITIGEAIERDSKRDFPFGKSVLKSTWGKYEIELKDILERHKPKYIEDAGLPSCVIIDIDGTLSNSYQRRIFDFKECINDKVIEPVRYILDIIRKANTNKCIVLMSGREEICREETEDWLNMHDIKYDYLYMRKAKDYRDDTSVKTELFNEYIKGKYYVSFVIDDRPSVVKTWIDMGLFVFNVNQDPLCLNNF
jgi:predicted kinase